MRKYFELEMNHFIVIDIIIIISVCHCLSLHTVNDVSVTDSCLFLSLFLHFGLCCLLYQVLGWI